MRELIHEYQTRQAEIWEKHRRNMEGDVDEAFMQTTTSHMLSEFRALAGWFAAEAAKL